MYIFEILTKGQSTVRKETLISVIRMFDLPIKFDEFFLPIGKKEILNFSDFCLLFQNCCGQAENMFIKSFQNGFKSDSTSRQNEQINENRFPISIIKLK